MLVSFIYFISKKDTTRNQLTINIMRPEVKHKITKNKLRKDAGI